MKAKKFIHDGGLFDTRSTEVKIGEFLSKPEVACSIVATGLISMIIFEEANIINNFLFIIVYLFYMWYRRIDIGLILKYPIQVKGLKHHKECKKANGMFYVGNQKSKEGEDERELWLSNSDARTHILFLGTTGSGKTEGLKLFSTNALSWGSGFVYVDGKADTELWASLYSLARRFGRDDDLLLLNYMTGNMDEGGKSNSMNPFSSGSASYLTNLLVGLMDEAGGDNAMWKGRAISLMTAIMPALTWQRDHEHLLLDVDTIRKTLTLDKIVSLSRSKTLPKKIGKGVFGYLDTLPGYVDAAFDDNGKEKPQGPDDPPHDLSTAYQQHGFLSMQFTRSLGSLADEYGYIFKQELADIDINDVVLNRRMMVVLIPILEKSGDEAANLGKIVVSSIKGMMGATLGADIEGSWEDIIENKVTKSNSPFVTIFDEVGYYTSQGMAAMAAQARSLGFSLVFAGQDLAAMEKRVKEEAKSITANCNLKIFGKLEDPGPTKEFFEKNVGKMDIVSQGNVELQSGMFGKKFVRKEGLSVQSVNVVTYDELRKQSPGHVHMVWAAQVIEAQMPWIQAPKLKAIRMQMLLKVKRSVSLEFQDNFKFSETIMGKYRDVNWSADKDEAVKGLAENDLINNVKESFSLAQKENKNNTEAGTIVIANTFGNVDLGVADASLDDFAKFFGDENAPKEKEEEDDDILLDNVEKDDFQKMLDSYKSDDFDDTPPFEDFADKVKEKEEVKEDVSSLYKPTIDLTNTLPWEEEGQEISDDVVNKALDEIWSREKLDSIIVNPDEKKEMSRDFMDGMKKYLTADNVDRKSVVNAVLRATADLISDNMGGLVPEEDMAELQDHADALHDHADEFEDETQEDIEIEKPKIQVSEEKEEDKPKEEAVVKKKAPAKKKVVKKKKEEKKEEIEEENEDIMVRDIEEDDEFSEFFS